MQTYHREATLEQDGILTVNDLPLPAGAAVEVIIIVPSAPPGQALYPLRGTPVIYHNPTEPVAEDDWEVLQ